MASELNGKVVVITGASAGIGAALAERVGALGGAPVLVARREAELLAATARAGKDALAVVADVAHRDGVEKARDAALARFGHVDAWVSNAGRGITRKVEDLTDEDLDDMMQINVKSVIYGVQALLPHFRSRGAGHFVHVSSMLGRVPFATFRSAYGASKHALNALTANLRMDLAASDPNIHVSLVLPGVVATDFGLNARHGGMDSRALPSAQPVSEVADVIAETLVHPRAEVYTRPGMREQAAAYYSAEDVAVVEAKMRVATLGR